MQKLFSVTAWQVPTSSIRGPVGALCIVEAHRQSDSIVICSQGRSILWQQVATSSAVDVYSIRSGCLRLDVTAGQSQDAKPSTISYHSHATITTLLHIPVDGISNGSEDKGGGHLLVALGSFICRLTLSEVIACDKNSFLVDAFNLSTYLPSQGLQVPRIQHLGRLGSFGGNTVVLALTTCGQCAPLLIGSHRSDSTAKNSNGCAGIPRLTSSDCTGENIQVGTSLAAAVVPLEASHSTSQIGTTGLALFGSYSGQVTVLYLSVLSGERSTEASYEIRLHSTIPAHAAGCSVLALAILYHSASEDTDDPHVLVATGADDRTVSVWKLAIKDMSTPQWTLLLRRKPDENKVAGRVRSVTFLNKVPYLKLAFGTDSGAVTVMPLPSDNSCRSDDDDASPSALLYPTSTTTDIFKGQGCGPIVWSEELEMLIAGGWSGSLWGLPLPSLSAVHYCSGSQPLVSSARCTAMAKIAYGLIDITLALAVSANFDVTVISSPSRRQHGEHTPQHGEGPSHCSVLSISQISHLNLQKELPCCVCAIADSNATTSQSQGIILAIGSDKGSLVVAKVGWDAGDNLSIIEGDVRCFSDIFASDLASAEWSQNTVQGKKPTTTGGRIVHITPVTLSSFIVCNGVSQQLSLVSIKEASLAHSNITCQGLPHFPSGTSALSAVCTVESYGPSSFVAIGTDNGTIHLYRIHQLGQGNSDPLIVAVVPSATVPYHNLPATKKPSVQGLLLWQRQGANNSGATDGDLSLLYDCDRLRGMILTVLCSEGLYWLFHWDPIAGGMWSAAQKLPTPSTKILAATHRYLVTLSGNTLSCLRQGHHSNAYEVVRQYAAPSQLRQLKVSLVCDQEASEEIFMSYVFDAPTAKGIPKQQALALVHYPMATSLGRSILPSSSSGYDLGCCLWNEVGDGPAVTGEPAVGIPLVGGEDASIAALSLEASTYCSNSTHHSGAYFGPHLANVLGMAGGRIGTLRQDCPVVVTVGSGSSIGLWHVATSVPLNNDTYLRLLWSEPPFPQSERGKGGIGAQAIPRYLCVAFVTVPSCKGFIAVGDSSGRVLFWEVSSSDTLASPLIEVKAIIPYLPQISSMEKATSSNDACNSFSPVAIINSSLDACEKDSDDDGIIDRWHLSPIFAIDSCAVESTTDHHHRAIVVAGDKSGLVRAFLVSEGSSTHTVLPQTNLSQTSVVELRSDRHKHKGAQITDPVTHFTDSINALAVKPMTTNNSRNLFNVFLGFDGGAVEWCQLKINGLDVTSSGDNGGTLPPLSFVIHRLANIAIGFTAVRRIRLLPEEGPQTLIHFISLQDGLLSVIKATATSSENQQEGAVTFTLDVLKRIVPQVRLPTDVALAPDGTQVLVCGQGYESISL